MTDFSEIKDILDAQNVALTEMRKSHDSRFKALEKETFELLKKAGRPGAGAGDGIFGNAAKRDLPAFIDTKSKQRIEVLSHKESLSQGSDTPCLGRVLRGMVLGGSADDARELADERKALSIFDDTSGGYAVSGPLSDTWIDALRANMVLSKAGAVTVPMASKTLTVAKVTGDPTVSWHGENASITATQPTFGATTLDAKTVVCVVKLSLELSQDSANIEQMLQTTLTNALAAAIDSAGLNGVTTDAGAAPAGLFGLTGRNTVTSIGAPTSWDFLTDGMYQLLLDNVPREQIGAFIAHPALWKKMSKLKTGIASDNTPLMLPGELAAIPKLYTTAAPLASTTAKGIIANWQDLLFGVRREITVKVLDQAFLGSNLQIAVLAYARVDFAATRVNSFCTLEGITV